MRKLSVLIMAVGLFAASCSAASEELTEQILESQEGVSNVEIDEDGGQISFETDDGSFSVGGGEIPNDYPVPFPDGGNVQTVITSDGGGQVSVAYPLDRYDELVAYYDEWTSGQPGEWNRSTFENDDGQGIVVFGTSWWTGDVNLGVANCYSLSGNADAPDATCVTTIVQY